MIHWHWRRRRTSSERRGLWCLLERLEGLEVGARADHVVVGDGRRRVLKRERQGGERCSLRDVRERLRCASISRATSGPCSFPSPTPTLLHLSQPSTMNRPPRQSMSELKLRRLTEHNARLKQDLERKTLRVSEASRTCVFPFRAPAPTAAHALPAGLLTTARAQKTTLFVAASALCTRMPGALRPARLLLAGSHADPIFFLAGALGVGFGQQERRPIRPAGWRRRRMRLRHRLNDPAYGVLLQRCRARTPRPARVRYALHVRRHGGMQ